MNLNIIVCLWVIIKNYFKKIEENAQNKSRLTLLTTAAYK